MKHKATTIILTTLAALLLLTLSSKQSVSLHIGAHRTQPGLTNTNPCFVLSHDDNEAGFCLNPMQVRFGEKASVRYNREVAELEKMKEDLQQRLATIRNRP